MGTLRTLALACAFGLALTSGAQAADQRLTDLLGAPLRDGAGQQVGTIANVVIDTANGHLDHLVLEDGRRLAIDPPTLNRKRPELFNARELLAARVEDRDGKGLGRIDEVVVSLDRGRIRYGVALHLAHSGPARRIAIPLAGVHRTTFGDHVVVTLDRDTLARAPALDVGALPATDPARGVTIALDTEKSRGGARP